MENLDRKHLFFVESPFQLLNAVEAINKFSIKEYVVFVRLSNNQNNDKQLKLVCNILNLNKNNVKFISISSSNKSLNDYLKLFAFRFRFMLKRNDIGKVFIGNYESRFLQLIIKQFPRNKIILLDDGSKTLIIQKKFTDSNYYNLFTMYDIKKIKGQKIYKNDYSYIKSLIKKKNVSNNILFLGSNLSEIGLMDKQEYFECLKNISEFYNENIIYVPHRNEDLEKVNYINKMKNFIVKPLDYPVELYGLYENEIPYKVTSFYSTALLTMKYIYNIEADSFYVNFASPRYKEDIKEIYKFYKNRLNVIQCR